MTLRTLSARRRLRIRSGLMVLIESESDKYSMTDKGQAYTSLPLAVFIKCRCSYHLLGNE